MLSWSDFEAVIPAVMSMPERAASVTVLLCDLARQCKGITVLVSPQWNPRPRTSDAYNAIAAGLAGVRKPWVLYFEDDIYLSSKFGEEVLKVMRKVEGDVGSVALFSPRPDDPLRLQRGEFLYPATLPFGYVQCNILRHDVALKMSEELIRQYATEESAMTPDIVLGDACKRLGLKILVSLPSLVQHRAGPSAFGNNSWPASPTFVP